MLAAQISQKLMFCCFSAWNPATTGRLICAASSLRSVRASAQDTDDPIASTGPDTNLSNLLISLGIVIAPSTSVSAQVDIRKKD